MKARQWPMWRKVVLGMVVCGSVGLLLLARMTGAQSPVPSDGQNAVFPGSGVDGPALSYTDNGDGTITDNNTQLMWEKKLAGGGPNTCLTSLQGVNSECTLAEAAAWIAAVNAANLGGHSDWRIPNVKELQSIVDYSKQFPGPTVDASFPGLTGGDDYWSSTPLASNPSIVRSVNFGDGGVNGDVTNFPLRVRAVRGGRS